MKAHFLPLAAFLACGPAYGQSLTIQQPVVDSISAGTTVSVPDSGAVMLGGVGRVRGGGTAIGPGRGGYGRGVSTAGMSANVFVHDLEAMDAAVLDAADEGGLRPVSSKGRYSDATSYAMARRYEAIRNRGGIGRPSSIGAGTDRTRVGGTADGAGPIDEAGRSLALGEAAERRGRLTLAALHYRAAAKRGSGEAARRLAGLPASGAIAGSDG